MGATLVRAVSKVNLSIASGEFVALMGPSGSGKSTLLHLIGCLESQSEGTYRLEGVEVGRLSARERAAIRNSRIGFIFQSFNLIPYLTAAGNVALPLLYQRGATDVRARAEEALARVGLSPRRRHHPAELSGGERQRVAIARALIAKPALLLADEPTGNLDSRTGDGVMRLLADLHESGRTVLVVTHDPQVAAYAHRCIQMRDGRIIADGTLSVSA